MIFILYQKDLVKNSIFLGQKSMLVFLSVNVYIINFIKSFYFLNLYNTWVVKFTSKVMIKLSGFFAWGKGRRMSLILLHRYGMNLDGPFSEKVIPCLEFSMEFQSNKLIYQKEYNKRQQIIYVLIQHLYDREGWGYRKISK